MQWPQSVVQSIEDCLWPPKAAPNISDPFPRIRPAAPAKPPNPSPCISSESDNESETSSDDSSNVERSSELSSEQSSEQSSGRSQKNSGSGAGTCTTHDRPEPKQERGRTAGVRPDAPPARVVRPALETDRGLQSLRWGREISFRAAWQIAPKQRLLQTTALAWETITCRSRRKVKFVNLVQHWSTKEPYTHQTLPATH